MPYITEQRRDEIYGEHATDELETAGELNFIITMAIKEYVQCNVLSYRTINDVLGALEGAKLEFYRRIAVPYEDQKIKENGDVY